MSWFHIFGDGLPRRGLDFLCGGAAFIGQLEKLFAAVTFACDQQSLVNQQLQGRVNRAGARAPQILAALGDLLDHFVAVHGPFGQQLENGCTDIAATASSAASPSSAAANTRSETEAAARIEAELKAATRPEGKRAAGTGVVLTEMAPELLAEVASRLTALLVKCPPVAGAESKAEAAGWRREWVGHGDGSLRFEGNAGNALPIR
jgi:hypothetical protein